MIFRILPEADDDATAAAHWYDKQQPELGDDFLDQVRLTVKQIRSNPLRHPRLESYSGNHIVRRALLARFPYMLVFACRELELILVAVAHVRRRPLYWLERLESD